MGHSVGPSLRRSVRLSVRHRHAKLSYFTSGKTNTLFDGPYIAPLHCGSWTVKCGKCLAVFATIDQFISRKHQHVSQRTFYCPLTFLTLKSQKLRSKTQKCWNSFMTFSPQQRSNLGGVYTCWVAVQIFLYLHCIFYVCLRFHCVCTQTKNTKELINKHGKYKIEAFEKYITVTSSFMQCI